MKVRIEECCRYMGVRGEIDPQTRALAESCVGELMERVTPRHVMREFPLRVGELPGQRAGGDAGQRSGTGAGQSGQRPAEPAMAVDLGCFVTHSDKLARNLAGCDRVLIFAATIGEGADFLIRRYARTEVSRHLAMQACAAALIEAYCDELCEGWQAAYAEEGCRMRPRFSPGYGDFDLADQVRICDVLKTGRTIGVTLTDSLLMLPSKSVTAVIGLEKVNLSGSGPETAEPSGSGCHLPEEGEGVRENCSRCDAVDCPYRKQEGHIL